MEIWKDVKGYENYYQISNKGRLKALSRYVSDFRGENTLLRKERIITPTDNGHGYLFVGLSKNHKRKNHYIHRLVAEAFLENPNNYRYVNHLDFNRKNNESNNLEWCSQRHNIDYSKHRMRKQHNSKVSASTKEKYIRLKDNKYSFFYRKNGKTQCYKSFDSLEEAVEFRNNYLKGVV